MKKQKGITLVALTITVVLLLVIAGITWNESTDVITNTRLQVFSTEMQIMQEQVNMLYQKVKQGEGTIQINNKIYNIIKNEENSYETLGKEYTNATNYQKVFEGAFGDKLAEINLNEYRYYDKETLEKLELEGINQEFLVNIQTRTIISLNPFEDNNDIYYTIGQLKSGTYNVEYQNPHEENTVNFDNTVTKNGESWEIQITNVETSKYVEKYNIQYQLKGSSYWQKADTNKIIVNNAGTYNIKVVDAAGNFKIQEVVVQ